jgi:hypothetical protein
MICLTPVKNEIWILDRFLKCASLWADHIIIADQSSDDGSREVALNYPKVTLVDNLSPTFSEAERQRILLEAARRIPGPRLLVALDADEVFTANSLDSPEWNSVLQAPVGIVIRSQLPVILPDCCSYWMPPMDYVWGFMDDGSDHIGKEIHSSRIPVPARAPTVALRSVKLMHYVGVDLQRWNSKHRWYQCWERLNNPQRGAISIYRQYHRKDVTPSCEIKPMPKEWLDGYERHGIDMTSVYREGIFRWDGEVLKLLIEHGPATFKREAIWDVDWSELYQKIYGESPPLSLQDPRSQFDKLVHRWLKRTQLHFSYFSEAGPKTTVRIVQRILKFLGW